MQEITKDQKDRILKTREAIDAVLDKYKMTLVPQLMMIAGQITNHSVGIVPQKEESRIVVPTLKGANPDGT